MKDAKMDANLACKGMKTHHTRVKVQTRQNKIDPATDSNTKHSIFKIHDTEAIFFFCKGKRSWFELLGIEIIIVNENLGREMNWG